MSQVNVEWACGAAYAWAVRYLSATESDKKGVDKHAKS
jgi:hypothetical protein